MLNKYSVGKYYLTNSFVHLLNPILKILSIIIVLISLIFINTYLELILFLLYLILALYLSKIKMTIYLKNILNLKIFILFILIVDVIFSSGIYKTIFDIYIVVYIVLYTALLTFTTPPTEITYGISQILKIFNKILPVEQIALTITLALRFIPMLMEQADNIIKAQKLRGIDFNSKNLKMKLNAISTMFVPMFIISLKKADMLSDIMSIRLYDYSKSRTNYRLNKWDYKSSLVLVLNIAMLIFAVIY